MPLTDQEIVEGNVLRQLVEYPLDTTINKVTNNIFNVNDKLLIIKELKQIEDEDEEDFDFDTDNFSDVTFKADDFKPFYSNQDFYIAFGCGIISCIHLLTPKDIRLLSLNTDAHAKRQVLKVEWSGRTFTVTNKKSGKSVTGNLFEFPNNFLKNGAEEDADEEDFDVHELEVRERTTYFPNLVTVKSSVCSIEIDAGSLQQNERYENDCFAALVIKELTAQWVSENSYSKKGTIWGWVAPSINFHHQSLSVFYIVLGMPKKFRTYLETGLNRKLGTKYIRSYSDEVVLNRDDGWNVTCHIEDGKVWQMIDPISWKEVEYSL